MKAATLDISKSGHLGGESLKMRIDENSLDFIMGVLSNLYSDPEGAVIRELSVNARDSHIEAGQTRPIEITTPNWMSPFFKVQDFGVGLSLDDIKNIYSAYGASTKRNTNEQTGSLGLGSKSPLTLTDQFTVISNKDGLKISVVVSRTETGGGTMQIVDTAPTDDPNGVTIIVPTQGGNAFEEKVKLFFRFWEPGKVLVNDKEPWHDEDLINVTDDLFIKPAGRYGGRDKDYLIMGGIGYPTEKLIPERDRYNKRGFAVFAHVPIGSVAFTPSREELHYTKATVDVIEQFAQEFRDNVGKVITDDIDGAEDRGAAWKAYVKWEQLVGSSNITVPPTYKSEKIPKNIKGKAAWYNANQYGNSKQKTVEFEDNFSVDLDKFYGEEYHRPIFVTNLPDDKYSTYTKGKVRAYCDINNYRSNKVIFTNDKALYEHPWLPATVVLDWNEVKKATRPQPQKRATHKQFPAFNGYDWGNQDIDTEKTTVYYVPDWSTSGLSFRNLYPIYSDKVQFFKIATNREERFKKLFPNAITLAAFSTQEKAKWDGELKWHELHHLHRTYPSWIYLMPVEKVDDPEVKAFILGFKEKSRHEEWKALGNALANVHMGSMNTPPAPSNPLDKYPLIAHLDTWRVNEAEIINEIATYMNGKFKELSA